VIRCSQNEGRKLNHMEVASEKRRAQDPIGKCHPKTLFNLVVDVNRIPCLYRRGSQAARSCRGESREEEKGPRGFRRAISRKGSRSEFDIGAGNLSDLLSTSLSTSMTICEMTICKHDYLQGKNNGSRVIVLQAEAMEKKKAKKEKGKAAFGWDIFNQDSLYKGITDSKWFPICSCKPAFRSTQKTAR
jgi:hypothetical protein